MHRTWKAETACPPQADLRAQQARFDSVLREFNQQGPHELPELEYRAHFYRRKAGPNGEISWDYSGLFIGRALVGEHVGVEPIEDGQCRLWFGKLPLGEFDQRADIQGKRRRSGGWLKLPAPSA